MSEADRQRAAAEAIRAHLERQVNLDPTRFVRLDTGEVVRVGGDAEGEDDDERQ